MTVFELADVIRSKNAGPLWLTLDIMFDRKADYERLLEAPAFTAERIAALYACEPKDVRIIPFPAVTSVKVTVPRRVVSGAASDDDIYGCQQHIPLASLELGIE